MSAKGSIRFPRSDDVTDASGILLGGSRFFKLILTRKEKR